MHFEGRPLTSSSRNTVAALALLASVLVGTSLAHAADGAAATAAAPAATTGAPATPLADFRTQIGDVKKSLEGVNAKIEDRAKAIETLSSPDAARKQVDELQALISQTLGLVADNGDIARLGAKALDYARGKQDQMRKDTKFSPAERAELQRRWDRNVADMVKATDELSKASTEFAQVLKIIQTRGDYASEVLEVENASEMLRVIQNLAGDVRGASETLKTFIRTLTPPDA
jgi:hypothetical protein